MPEKYALGLTRNRLFDFNNCVSFVGEIDGEIDARELSKALKMLSVREPLITAAVVLEEDGEAYAVTEMNAPSLCELTGSVENIVSEQRKSDFDFTKALFRFALVNCNTIGIFAHTLIADAKSLLLLACELLAYCDKRLISVEPLPVKLFSSKGDLPANVFSPIVDKVTSELDSGWKLKERIFTADDYREAREKYIKQNSDCESVVLTMDEKKTSTLAERCKELNIDCCSAVAFAFYKSLVSELGGDKKYRKIKAAADERLYFPNSADYRVGPFTAYAAVSPPSKKQPDITSEAVQFHKEYYKKVTNPFQAFYNEVFFINLSPSFCDSAFLYEAGCIKNKYSKKLATVYGCMAKRIMGFCAYNLNQQYWQDLERFNSVTVSEPLKSDEDFLVTLIMNKGKITLTTEYRKSAFDNKKITLLCEKALEILQSL